MKRIFLAALAALSFLSAHTLPAHAQWLTQTIVVSNGWTAAYLFVDASSQNIIPSTPGLPISAGNPIDKIWLWKAPPSTAQYLTTPASPLSGGGPWVSWALTNAQNSLVALIPNAAYLIHSTSATSYSWRIQGQPVAPHYTWDLTGLNFIGFATPSNNPPNFQSFLAPATAISGVVQIYRYLGGELSTQPANPALVISPYYTPVVSGQAYWISATNVNNSYFGPFQITLPNPSGISYGTTGGQVTFYLLNVTPNPLTVTMKVVPSETPPFGQTNILGPPPLLVEGAQNPTNLTYAYTALSATGAGGLSNSLSWTLAPSGQSGSEVPITLGVNRFALTSGPAGSLYAAILQFTDSLGFSSINIPVSAVSANSAGLWVGKASITNVNYDLKTYGTNADGSLATAQATNAVVTTNNFILGTTTNLAINQSFITNVTINNFQVTNLFVNTYTTNSLQPVSNGVAISTNWLLDYTISTNTVIETDVLGYYFTNNNQLLVWITTNIDYAPALAVQTNLFETLVTNTIAAVPTNGTPVTVTNFMFSAYSISSYLVTNGIFESPVTNLAFATNYSVTNSSTATTLAYNVIATNQIAGSFSSSNGPFTFVYSTTNLQISASGSTNFYPTPHPLYEATNGSYLISLNVQTNNFFVTNVVNTYYTTNSLVISNNYTINQGVTDLVSIITNVLYTQMSASGAETTNFSSSLTLLAATNPLLLVVTNYFSTPASNYIVASHNTQGDSVAAPYPLRLIVFSDHSGNCSLLQRVYWGLNLNSNLVVSSSQSALDPTHLDSARRITATHLPWAPTNQPWAFSGGPLAQGATLTSAPIVEDYADQAANPFLHTYHPDHNNLDTQSPPHQLPIGSESYQITRVISLSLMPNTNDFLSLTSANSTLAGQYNESITLTGLGGFSKSYQTIGAFSLTQISTLSTLVSQ
ncbi:exported hypothetical protein [Verrucomicrobia bacterium]|nr:exported hypothetical protein [Verrucomicrobiota bacterium]